MNTTENQRVKLSKRLLRESLIKLLETQPLYDITVRQLCAEAEMNRSTFYKYYDNIRQIYEEIENEVLTASLNCLARIDAASDEKTIIKRVEELLLHIREQPELYRLLLENSSYEGFSYKLIAETIGPITDMYMPQLGKGKKKKHAEYRSLFTISGVLAIIKRWLDTDMKESPNELAEVLVQIAAAKMSSGI